MSIVVADFFKKFTFQNLYIRRRRPAGKGGIRYARNNFTIEISCAIHLRPCRWSSWNAKEFSWNVSLLWLVASFLFVVITTCDGCSSFNKVRKERMGKDRHRPWEEERVHRHRQYDGKWRSRRKLSVRCLSQLFLKPIHADLLYPCHVISLNIVIKRGYSSVEEHPTAYRNVPGSNPGAPLYIRRLSIRLILGLLCCDWFEWWSFQHEVRRTALLLSSYLIPILHRADVSRSVSRCPLVWCAVCLLTYDLYFASFSFLVNCYYF